MQFKKHNQEAKFFEYFSINNYFLKSYFNRAIISNVTNLYNHQLDWFKACATESPVTLIAAPRQKGKTLFAISYALFQNMMYNKKVAIIGNSFFVDNLKKHKITDKIDVFNSNNLLSLVGVRYDLIIIDEIGIAKNQKELLEICALITKGESNRVVVISSFYNTEFDQLVKNNLKQRTMLDKIFSWINKDRSTPNFYNVFLTLT